MNTRSHSALHRLPRLVDVGLVGACQAGNNRRRHDLAVLALARRSADRVGNLSHCIQIAGAGSRETRFHNVHTQTGKLGGNIQFFLGVERGAGALLAIAQRGVEDHHRVAMGDLARIGANVVNFKLGYIYIRNVYVRFVTAGGGIGYIAVSGAHLWFLPGADRSMDWLPVEIPVLYTDRQGH